MRLARQREGLRPRYRRHRRAALIFLPIGRETEHFPCAWSTFQSCEVVLLSGEASVDAVPGYTPPCHATAPAASTNLTSLAR